MGIEIKVLGKGVRVCKLILNVSLGWYDVVVKFGKLKGKF